MMAPHVLLCLTILLSHVIRSSALFGGELQPGSDCSVCPPGYGVTSMCDKDAGLDTECQECANGTFNEQYTPDAPCQSCTTCMTMHYAWRACSRIKDASCLPCKSYNARAIPAGPAYDNEDYLRQCEGKTTTPTPTPTSTITTEKTLLGCRPGETVPNPKQTTTKTTTTKLSSPTNKELAIPVITYDDLNTTVALGAEEVVTSSSNWIIIVVVLAGALLFFIVGGVIAVCLRTKTHNKQNKSDVYSDTSSHDDEEGFGDSDDDMDAIRKLDVTQTLFPALPTSHGHATSGTTLLTNSTPDLTRGTPRTITPSSPRRGQSGPRESPVNHPGPTAATRVVPLTGAPAVNSINSPADMPRKHRPLFPKRRRTPPPVPSSETPLNQSYFEQDVTPAVSQVHSNRLDHRELRQPDSRGGSTSESSKLWTPDNSKKSHLTSKTPTPTDSVVSTPNQTPVTRHHRRPQSKMRPWPSKRMHGSFNRNLPYIDKDSGDEIVRQVGRPPRENFKDPTDKKSWGLSRKLAALFDRIRKRQPIRSDLGPHNVPRDFDDSRIDDTMNDISFEFTNDSMVSFDYHNTTSASSEFNNPHLY